MTQWHYTDANHRRQGPVETAELADLYRQGRVPADALVWREGLGEWRTLQGVAGELGIDAAGLPPPVPRAAMAAGDEVVYAGFWRRYCALFIDGIVLGVPVIVVAVVVAVALGVSRADKNTIGVVAEIVYYLLWLLSAPLYYALQESSKHQATLGKRALGIKVVDLQGGRINFKHALGRWFAAALSYITLYIGFLMAAFTERKQALHDIVAGTLVVDKHAYTDQPQLQKRGLHGCLIALLIGVIAVVPIAILAAIALPAYQDYTIRAQVAAAVSEAAPLKAAVVNAGQGQCPRNGENGLGAAASYATPLVDSIEVGQLEDGHCAIAVHFGAKSHFKLRNQTLLLEYEAPTSSWHSNGAIADKYLPRDLRDNAD